MPFFPVPSCKTTGLIFPMNFCRVRDKKAHNTVLTVLGIIKINRPNRMWNEVNKITRCLRDNNTLL